MTEAGDLKRILDAAWNAEGIEAAHRRERRSLYSSVAGSPTLRPSVVTYLDVLGTKDRSSRLTLEQLRSDIEDIDDWQSELHSDFWDSSRQRFVSFSDNVAVAAPYEHGALNDVLQHQLDAVASFQLRKVLSGRGLRGGIVKGDVFCDGTTSTGQRSSKPFPWRSGMPTCLAWSLMTNCRRLCVPHGAPGRPRSGRTSSWPSTSMAGRS